MLLQLNKVLYVSDHKSPYLAIFSLIIIQNAWNIFSLKGLIGFEKSDNKCLLLTLLRAVHFITQPPRLLKYGKRISSIKRHMIKCQNFNNVILITCTNFIPFLPSNAY